MDSRTAARLSGPAVLELQRSAGNAAVVSIVQRYGSGEHAQLGSSETVEVHGVTFTRSEIIAMGDFYKTPDDMQAASPAELRKLRELIRRDTAASQGVKGSQPVGSGEWQTATGGRYLKLAQENATHFAPPKTGPKGTDHRTEFEEHHSRALHLANQAAVKAGASVDVPDEAHVVNSFGAHFLTDAFAAGHLVAKEELMDEAKKYWAKVPTTGIVFKESSFTQAVARGVLGNSAGGATLARKELKIVEWGPVSAQRFSEFIMLMAAKKPDDFFNAFAKIIHDKLNDSIKGGGPGIEVTNRKGDTWKLSGDGTLGQSAKTAAIARAAVAQSERNLQQAASSPDEPDYAALTRSVWNYTPVPTAAGSKEIRKTIARFADAAKKDCVDAFTALAVAELSTLIAKLTAEGRMRDRSPGRGVRPPAKP